jgi:hypothetical protein
MQSNSRLQTQVAEAVSNDMNSIASIINGMCRVSTFVNLKVGVKENALVRSFLGIQRNASLFHLLFENKRFVGKLLQENTVNYLTS